jgi:hypothetical protein
MKLSKFAITSALFIGTHIAHAELPTNDRVAISLVHPAICATCPNWELKIYQDGSARFMGYDAVRMLGENGTFDSPAYKQFMSSDHASSLQPPVDLTFLNSARNAIEKAQALAEKIVGEEKDETGRSDVSIKNTNDSGVEKYELRLRLVDGSLFERTIFLDPSSKGELKDLVDTVKAAYYSPADWQPSPAFSGDPNAVFLIQNNRVNAQSLNCDISPEDYRIIIYRTGQVRIIGRAYARGSESSALVDETVNIGEAQVRRLLQEFNADLPAMQDARKKDDAAPRPPPFNYPAHSVGDRTHIWGRWRNFAKDSRGEMFDITNLVSVLNYVSLPTPSFTQDLRAISRTMVDRLGPVPPIVEQKCLQRHLID